MRSLENTIINLINNTKSIIIRKIMNKNMFIKEWIRNQTRKY